MAQFIARLSFIHV